MPLPAVSNRKRILGTFVLLAGWAMPTMLVQAQTTEGYQPPSITIAETPQSLPDPTLGDSADDEAVAAAMETARGKYPLSRFTKDSIVAPFRFERESIRDANGERMGHQIDLWFVAHGSLDTIRDRKLLQTFMESKEDDDASQAKELTSEQLSARKIETSPSSDQSWITFQTEILDRVAIRGVMSRQLFDTPKSILASAAMDDRFLDDDEFPNQWWGIGKSASTDRRAYRGLAGYAKATPIRNMDDALLVECHAIVHEPSGWFGGANLLGSKLPLVVQDAVRDFRRTLGKKR